MEGQLCLFQIINMGAKRFLDQRNSDVYQKQGAERKITRHNNNILAGPVQIAQLFVLANPACASFYSRCLIPTVRSRLTHELFMKTNMVKC